MVRISVAICCVDAAATLGPACRSVVDWADELLVVDSGSSDGTAEIARRYAHRFVQEPWRGYGEQKRFAASLCRNEWVLVLDADEEVSPTLAQELRGLDAAALRACDVVYMRRRHYLMGRSVRAWWPDWQSRLIHRDRAIWDSGALHDARLPTAPERVRWLEGWLEHKRHSSDGFGDYFSGRRQDGRLMVVARDMHERGVRAHWWDLAVRPAAAFLKFYFIKRGYLDGAFGLLVAQKAMMGVQLKYAALWAVQHGLADPDPAIEPGAAEPTEPTERPEPAAAPADPAPAPASEQPVAGREQDTRTGRVVSY